MPYLIAGVLLFALVHFDRTLFAAQRQAIVARCGETSVKAFVAVVLLISVWLMSKGWSVASAAPLWTAPLWTAPVWAKHVAVALMVPALVLFSGSYPGSALRARIRHPQLTGFKLWAALHLLANGELRSVVLFGGLLAWAVVQLILINRRDGKPPLPAAADNLLLAWMAVPVGVLAWIGLLMAHPWLFGVDPLG